MVHKGQRTNAHRERDYPHAIDIPIGPGGLGQKRNAIEDAARACAGRTEIWSYRTRKPNGDPHYGCRVGTVAPDDADRLAGMFIRIGARRVR